MKRNVMTAGYTLTLVLCVSNCFAAAAAGGLDIPVDRPASAVSKSSVGVLGNLPANAPDLLDRVKLANEELYSNLQSFVCHEQMERFKGSLKGDKAKHVDTVTTKVSFENGVEHYTDVYQDQRTRANIASVRGAWSVGEFGTLLQQTQVLLKTQPVVFSANRDLDGRAAAVYEVQVSEKDSPWDLQVEQHHYRLPFRTEVWVSQVSGQILKIERASTSIPSQVGISEIRWGVTLQTVQLEGKSWLLPKTGDYAVLYDATGQREWNELSFSGYHRYGSEVALRFE